MDPAQRDVHLFCGANEGACWHLAVVRRHPDSYTRVSWTVRRSCKNGGLISVRSRAFPEASYSPLPLEESDSGNLVSLDLKSPSTDKQPSQTACQGDVDQRQAGKCRQRAVSAEALQKQCTKGWRRCLSNQARHSKAPHQLGITIRAIHCERQARYHARWIPGLCPPCRTRAPTARLACQPRAPRRRLRRR